ncbi:hypothetical protein HY417_00180 [Candidatus Kaiserbacteria bacterium]|nr:hypothetical protein [Candidatus Kaiserbacteria bacterium]
MQNKRGFIGVGALMAILVGLAVLGGGAYYVTHQQTTSQITSENPQDTLLPNNTLPTKNTVSNQQQKQFTPAPTATTGWKTYTSAQYGISIQYPANWTNCASNSGNSRLQGSPRLLCIESNVSTAFGNPALAVTVQNDLKNKYPDYVSLKTYLSAPDPFSGAKRSPIELIIGGRATLKSEACDADCWGSYYIFTDKDLIAIKYSGNSSEFGQIVSTVKFTPPPTTDISVPAMSRYIDADFGFSFWYPSGWKLEELPNTNFATAYQGGTVKRRWQLWSMIDNDHSMKIEEYYSPSASITLNAESACPGGICSETLRFYFDASLHTWMEEYPLGVTTEREGDGIYKITPGTKIPADVSNNTMGGLHIFTGGFRGASMVIPLSAHNFVVVSDMPWNVGPTFKSYLVNTIGALDPEVATPVSNAEQIKTIQAEQSFYTSIVSHAPVGQ